MKTDYEALGKASMERLRKTTARAWEMQEILLKCLLEENSSTVFGKQHDFLKIDSWKAYQEMVPLSSYQDYEPYLKALERGEEKQLTAKEPVYFSLSSGSTGTPKYVPVTQEDMEVHFHYAYGAVFGMVQEYYQRIGVQDIWGKIFQTGDFYPTYMENGKMCGIRSSSLYQWLEAEGRLDVSDYTSPKELLFPEEFSDTTYAKVRFALAERNVKAVHSVFINRLTSLLEYISAHWEMLLSDMEAGTVNEKAGLSEKDKKRLVQMLPPDPDRAEELRRAAGQGKNRDLLRAVWPELKYVLTIGGSMFAPYMERLREFAGDVPVHYFAYAASEGIYGIADGLNRPDAYILLPESGVFEFLPEHGTEDTIPLSMREVEKGGKYEFIFTNRSGLYRYRTRDVIQIMDFFGQAPVIRVCYRRDQLPCIADERISMEMLDQAVAELLREFGFSINGYCMRVDLSEATGRYLIYMETAKTGLAVSALEKHLEEHLKEVSFDYRSCRAAHTIGALRLVLLKVGAFSQYEDYLKETGRLSGQTKPLQVLDTEEKKEFFEKRMVQR